MNLLALAIFVSTVLFLVDRNRVWPQFWKASKWVAIVGVIALSLFVGYSYYQTHHAARIPEDLKPYAVTH